MIEEKALVHRGSLVWPHVHAASLLMSACVEFFLRLGGGRSSAADCVAPTPLPERERRLREPVFLQGSLCEHVVDSSGHEFWVCRGDVEHDEYACRCTAKNGHWVWYCTERSY